jgi:6-phospho-3-hexuloisomerase
MKAYTRLVLSEIEKVLENIDDEQGWKLIREIKNAKRIYIAGVGRSGLAVKAFGQRLMHMGHSVHLADEITAPGITAKDLLVCCSGTGRTTLTLYMARKARAIGARVCVLTADKKSPLAQTADVVVQIPAPLEHRHKRRGVPTLQPARSLFEQSLFLFLETAVLMLMEKLRIPRETLDRRHANLE